jgi:hypothetical protein
MAGAWDLESNALIEEWSRTVENTRPPGPRTTTLLGLTVGSLVGLISFFLVSNLLDAGGDEVGPMVSALWPVMVAGFAVLFIAGGAVYGVIAAWAILGIWHAAYMATGIACLLASSKNRDQKRENALMDSETFN